MWKCIQIDNENYAISSRKEKNVYNVFLTDFVSVWNEQLIFETIIERCKVLNPLLKIQGLNVEEIVTEILSQFPEVPEVTKESNNCRIMLYKNIKGGKFKFELNLSKGSDRDFFETVTKSLFSTAIDLSRKYSILEKIVKEKDEEIAEYKAEGAQLIRKNIETKPFTEDLLKLGQVSSNETCKNTFKSLVNFCNEAENLDFRCNIFEKIETKDEKAEEDDTKDEEVEIEDDRMKTLDEKMKIQEEKMKTSPIKAVSSDSSVSPNKGTEEAPKNNLEENFLTIKRKIKGISASFTKPVKKTKNRVTSFIS